MALFDLFEVGLEVEGLECLQIALIPNKTAQIGLKMAKRWGFHMNLVENG